MATKQTPKVTDKQHAATQGCCCPLCGSTDITAGDWDAEGSSQEVECDDCGATWNDVYKMIGFSDLTDADGNPVPNHPK